MKFPNRVLSFRETACLTREQLASLIGVTRQTIGLIETGKVNPSTVIGLKLAKALSTTVEELFDMDNETMVRLHRMNSTNEDMSGRRVLLSTIRGARVARVIESPFVSFEAADGVIQQSVSQHTARVRLFHHAPPDDSPIFVSGCDLSLGLLAQHCTTQGAYRRRTIWFPTTNALAIQELKEGTAHVAAVHIDPESVANFTQYELPFPVRVFHLAKSTLGWVVRTGNPGGFSNVHDLQSGKFRLVNRPIGSGVRTILDETLKQAGIEGAKLPGYSHVASGHTEVVSTILYGGADVGIANETAAAMHRMHFLPIREEISALIVADAGRDAETTEPLLQRLHSDEFRRDLSAFGIYDTRQMGSAMKKEIS